MGRIYACIDLKSFYASVECQERGLNPLTTNLVVADAKRTEKTICLAVTPSLKAYGIGGRARLFEVISKVKEINKERKRKSPYHCFFGSSFDDNELKSNPELELTYIIAKPRMSYYLKYSTQIYNIYLEYLSANDVYSYSIDEIFCDITAYLKLYQKSPKELITEIIQKIYERTGITATAGIGSNLYLAKIAMDIVAKHTKPDEFGVRIATLDEKKYRELLWTHQPLTDFWRIGKGYANKLNENSLYTMGDIARCSLNNQELLYKLFGINAELLIDHAWGYEPCTIKDIKSYKPETNCLCSAQVLKEPYEALKARLVVKEMAELISLDLVEKRLITKKITLTIGYDAENLKIPSILKEYTGEITTDAYGREIPKHSHGTSNFDHYTSSSKLIMAEFLKLYDRIVNYNLLIRRISLTVCNVIFEDQEISKPHFEQCNLFTDYEKEAETKEKALKEEKEERKLQRTIINIKNKYGKNSLLKGMDLEQGATTKERNQQIGGHSK